MNKIFSCIKASVVCLLALAISVLNFSIVAGATEPTAPEATAPAPAAPAAAAATTTANTEGTIAAVVVIESYTVEGGPLEAGKNVNINLTLHNTSRTTAATSILMTVSSSSGLIYPAYGNDNQFFVGTIAAGASETITVPISVSQAYSSQAVDFTCSFDYASLNTKLSNQATIVIPSSGGGSIEVKSVSVSSHATVNGESLLSISYSNLTNEKITDAQILVDGNVSLDSKVIPLDTIKAGKNYSEDCRITFTQAGDQEIDVVFAYTDIDGTRVETELGKYSVEVAENQTATVSSENEEAMLWAGRGISAAGLILAIVAIVLYIKKR